MPDQPESYEEKRRYWQNVEREQPEDIPAPGPGQESVWDYPRPPRVEPVEETVRVEFGGEVVAESQRALRVVETASPPVYYVPPEDVKMKYLQASEHSSFCEWKGIAHYWTVKVGDEVAANAAWSYPAPEKGYEQIKDYLAFYPGRVEACFVGRERVEPQPGTYYGGWITSNIIGPFKGAPGTEKW